MKTYRIVLTGILFLGLALTGASAFAQEAKGDTAKTEAAKPAAAKGSVVVNVNTATPEQLALLPRVGPALAARIVAFREKNGDLKRPEDLMLVEGIGEKTFELMAPWVTVTGKTTLSEKVRTASKSGSSGGKQSE
ncbi:MAG: helix-hairpin-helix domain-containing protein [Thermoanaerobaculia bacterium]|nr:helix-hairpin-helix domain-containing protein [Thermoanaerobaculia bacterium]